MAEEYGPSELRASFLFLKPANSSEEVSLNVHGRRPTFSCDFLLRKGDVLQLLT